MGFNLAGITNKIKAVVRVKPKTAEQIERENKMLERRKIIEAEYDRVYNDELHRQRLSQAGVDAKRNALRDISKRSPSKVMGVDFLRDVWDVTGKMKNPVDKGVTKSGNPFKDINIGGGGNPFGNMSIGKSSDPLGGNSVGGKKKGGEKNARKDPFEGLM